MYDLVIAAWAWLMGHWEEDGGLQRTEGCWREQAETWRKTLVRGHRDTCVLSRKTCFWNGLDNMNKILQDLQMLHFVCWLWSSWTQSNSRLPTTDPESGLRLAESTVSLVHYFSSAWTSDENLSYKNIQVDTLEESFLQGAVSSSSQKAQPQGTVLPGTFLLYFTGFWNAHWSGLLKLVAACIVKKTLHISLWQTAVPENFIPLYCSTKTS